MSKDSTRGSIVTMVGRKIGLSKISQAVCVRRDFAFDFATAFDAAFDQIAHREAHVRLEGIDACRV